MSPTEVKQEIELSHTQFIQQFDVVPQFWQFLQGLRFEDLIVELIQNDLDANAFHTSIAFHPDRLLCHGNGDSIQRDGWQRLTYIMGAGDQVQSKQFRIGIKKPWVEGVFQTRGPDHTTIKWTQNASDSLQRRP